MTKVLRYILSILTIIVDVLIAAGHSDVGVCKSKIEDCLKHLDERDANNTTPDVKP